MAIFRFLRLPLLVLFALVPWLFIIGLAGGLSDIYIKLILDEDHELPPADIAILIPSILFFLALFFEHLPCLKAYERSGSGSENLYALAKWAWVVGMIANSILVVAIFFREQVTPIPTRLSFDELFSISAACALVLPAAIIRFCAMLQCSSHNSKKA